MSPAITIRRLSPEAVLVAAPTLADVLLDCVAGGASVNFMADLSRARAEGFWRGVAEAARDDGRVVIVAEADGVIVGTVQLVPVRIDNQPHRAEVAKLLVSRAVRGAGVGAALMGGIEAAARDLGRTLLTLDTVDGEAGDRLYRRMGWSFVGSIPNYALYPDGRPAATNIFYKEI
jgi:GNAT superfamily N-acetyltransferase